jgi:hypothetical protein
MHALGDGLVQGIIIVITSDLWPSFQGQIYKHWTCMSLKITHRLWWDFAHPCFRRWFCTVNNYRYTRWPFDLLIYMKLWTCISLNNIDFNEILHMHALGYRLVQGTIIVKYPVTFDQIYLKLWTSISCISLSK